MNARPPVAKKVPKQNTAHGELRVDNYFWLREKSNPEVITYLEAENAYSDAVLEDTKAFQKSLYREMVGRIKETDSSVPYRFGCWWYYSRTEEGRQYTIYCRKQGSLDGAEQITLDLNELAKKEKFLSLGAYAVSDDGNILAYSIDTTGSREYTLYFKDLRTGNLLPDRIEKTDEARWASDSRTLFYTSEDEAKRPYRLNRHILGNAKDDVVYEEKDRLYALWTYRSRDKTYLFVFSASATTSEARCIPSARPGEAARLVQLRELGHEYYVDHHAGLFYIRTNKGAKNFRIVTAPVSEPQAPNWKEFIPHRKDVMLEDIDFFADHAVVSERENGLAHFNIIDLRNGSSHRIDQPEPVYSIYRDENPEFHTSVFRFRYQSLVTPRTIFDYHMDSRERRLLKRTEVGGGFDSGHYVSERIYARTHDGARVPISIVYKKGMKRDGSNPLLLYAYGAYGLSLPNNFSVTRLSLLDRGIIYAQAHVRGGGDLAKEWHDQGKMMSKRNTFNDFIASAQYLIDKEYTSNQRLIIKGASAGGLLMGAVTNMRPDLFKLVISSVPFVDVINTMFDGLLPLTIGEYLEWGNPNEKKVYEYMKLYCPYTNLAAKKYPTMLVRASVNDSQVMYWEPAKYVAKLRTLKTDENLLLLKTNMSAGHGGASGRYDALREDAFDFAFILSQLGITK